MSKMKIAYLHYHLKTGGVTTVIRQQVEMLKKDCSLLVLSGEPSQLSFPAEVVHIPGIAYDTANKTPGSPEKIAGDIYQAILKRWEGGCDLLHVHNPTLAKNRAFLDILKALQKRGVNLFLQIHDFAEDGRPLFYFQETYPHDCHYGVINSRDYQILLNAGLKPGGLHKVFNPVKPLELEGRRMVKADGILYPIRAIRRKNIGEAVLLSLYFKQNKPLSITLPPNSPVDLKAYDGWKRFAAENRLNVNFDSGLEDDFTSLVGRSRFLLTTSITEGFGFSFLEAWTAGKLLWGRDLPDITDDFKRKGIRLDHLYPNLSVPLIWIDRHRFFIRWKACILDNSARFSLSLPAEAVENTSAKMLDSGLIDFGLLDEFFQKNVIRTLLSSSGKRALLTEINPFLVDPGTLTHSQQIIKNNRDVISRAFSPWVYKENLLEVYAAVSRKSVHHHIDKKRLAASFFNLDTFSLLKWRDYVE